MQRLGQCPQMVFDLYGSPRLPTAKLRRNVVFNGFAKGKRELWLLTFLTLLLLLSQGIAAIRYLAQEALGLIACCVGCPRAPMPADADGSLLPSGPVGVTKQIPNRIRCLTPCAKATNQSVPNL